jgi:hypothetical protein
VALEGARSGPAERAANAHRERGRKEMHDRIPRSAGRVEERKRRYNKMMVIVIVMLKTHFSERRRTTAAKTRRRRRRKKEEKTRTCDGNKDTKEIHRFQEEKIKKTQSFDRKSIEIQNCCSTIFSMLLLFPSLLCRDSIWAACRRAASDDAARPEKKQLDTCHSSHSYGNYNEREIITSKNNIIEQYNNESSDERSDENHNTNKKAFIITKNSTTEIQQREKGMMIRDEMRMITIKDRL